MPVDQSPAFSFYAKDFLLGTVTMSLAERGAYITLLAYQWDRGSVPTEPAELSRIWGCSGPQADKLWRIVGKKFERGADDLFRNARLEHERAKQAAFRATQAENGHKGAIERWGRHPSATGAATGVAMDSPMATTMAKNSFPSPSPNKDLSVHTPEIRSTRTVEPDVDPIQRRAGQLVQRYAELFLEHRRGARYHSRIHLDFAKACDLVRTWTDDARLEKLAVIVLTTDDEWVARTDRGFAVFAARATWADDRLKMWELEHQVQT